MLLPWPFLAPGILHIHSSRYTIEPHLGLSGARRLLEYTVFTVKFIYFSFYWSSCRDWGDWLTFRCSQRPRLMTIGLPLLMYHRRCTSGTMYHVIVLSESSIVIMIEILHRNLFRHSPREDFASAGQDLGDMIRIRVVFSRE